MHGQRFLWFIIGSLLFTYGVLIVAADFYYRGHELSRQVVMAQAHMGLWWGVFLIVLGGFYIVHFRPGKKP